MKKSINLSNFIYILILVLADLLVLIFSFELVFYFKADILQGFIPEAVDNYKYKFYWIILITLVTLFFENIYFVRYDFWSETKRVFKALFISFVVVFFVIILSKISEDYTKNFILLFYALAIFFIPTSKRLLKRNLFKIDFFKINVKVVGNSNLVEEIKDEIKNNWYFGFKYDKRKPKLVIIVSKNLEAEKLQKIIKKYSKFIKDIYVIPYMYHLNFSYSSVVDYNNIRISAIHIENRLMNIQSIIIKNIFEKLIVILALPFALILHIIISILIKIDSFGDILYKQKRLGEKGKIFSCYKYRSMYINGDEILEEYLKNNPEEIEYYSIYHKYKHDPRITRVGKFLRATSLDEFPQFFNILRNDMNLIGPRPYMICEKSKIAKENEDIILEVKPGITGLWQVSGRNNLSFEKRVELDKWYIQNWSLWMDFIIFIKTIKVVLFKIGAK
ncbi:UDP-phosphate galactose phosphotransferase [Aliarcobacter cryaerophilus]|uniref:UDP-phosphate galactose phosphotransferase n=1 Tax=Aliarcobacter cryaerophilus TaxID=28198 RepID=A0A2S9T4Z2_9BACT|nr:sugar transferase [Aliarcobacter cryaerophilus]PRM93898.1 UDP-phosphate galactose phosphotransferase [Aliarcobacter cryaerophilus]